MHIRKGDTVLIMTGDSRDHGKKGRVLAVYPKKDRILVEGINFVSRHTRPTRNNQQGGIVQKEAPVHISNVMAWCESAGKPSKIIMQREAGGTRKRIFKVNGETVKNNE